MEQLLEWLDGIAFSRIKKNITRDFADGVFVAELMRIYFPDLVQIHNYPPVSAKNARFSNWKTLNCNISLIQKRFSKSLSSKCMLTISPISSMLSQDASSGSSTWSTARSVSTNRNVKLKIISVYKPETQFYQPKVKYTAKSQLSLPRKKTLSDSWEPL